MIYKIITGLVTTGLLYFTFTPTPEPEPPRIVAEVPAGGTGYYIHPNFMEYSDYVHHAVRLWDPYTSIDFYWVDDPELAALDFRLGGSGKRGKSMYLGMYSGMDRDWGTITMFTYFLSIGTECQIRKTVVHEVGHFLGLDHGTNRDTESVMTQGLLEVGCHKLPLVDIRKIREYEKSLDNKS